MAHQGPDDGKMAESGGPPFMSTPEVQLREKPALHDVGDFHESPRRSCHDGKVQELPSAEEILEAEDGDVPRGWTAAELLAKVELLNESEFMILSDAVHRKDKAGLATKPDFAGGAWFTPALQDVGADEPSGCISFEWGKGLTLAGCGKRITFNVASLLLRACYIAVGWWTLWLILPNKIMSPGGVVFDPLACFFISAFVGGLCGRIAGMPPLVFILLFAIMWANIHDRRLVKGIIREVRTIVSRCALSVILVRSGVSLSWKVVKPSIGYIVGIGIGPALAEILAHGFLAQAVFDYGDEPLWPFLQSVVCTVGAPAVLGATYLIMRTWGFGNSRGPGVIGVPGVVIDTVLGIWAINFMVTLIFREPGSNLAWTIAQGPVQIVVGIIAGVIMGCTWYLVFLILMSEARKLPHGAFSKGFLRIAARNAAIVLQGMGLCSVFFGYYYKCAGGGAVAAAMMGATVSFILSRDGVPAEYVAVKLKIYAYLTLFWENFMNPAVFSVPLTSVDVKTWTPGFGGKAVACLMVGGLARLLTYWGITWTYPMSKTERLISGLANPGRAAIQVALGSLALNTAKTRQDRAYAKQTYDVAIIGVLIYAPLTMICLTKLAPIFWLKDAEHDKIEKEKARLEAEAKAKELGEVPHEPVEDPVKKQ